MHVKVMVGGLILLLWFAVSIADSNARSKFQKMQSQYATAQAQVDILMVKFSERRYSFSIQSLHEIGK